MNDLQCVLLSDGDLAGDFSTVQGCFSTCASQSAEYVWAGSGSNQSASNPGLLCLCATAADFARSQPNTGSCVPCQNDPGMFCGSWVDSGTFAMYPIPGRGGGSPQPSSTVPGPPPSSSSRGGTRTLPGFPDPSSSVDQTVTQNPTGNPTSSSSPPTLGSSPTNSLSVSLSISSGNTLTTIPSGPGGNPNNDPIINPVVTLTRSSNGTNGLPTGTGVPDPSANTSSNSGPNLTIIAVSVGASIIALGMIIGALILRAAKRKRDEKKAGGGFRVVSPRNGGASDGGSTEATASLASSDPAGQIEPTAANLVFTGAGMDTKRKDEKMIISTMMPPTFISLLPEKPAVQHSPPIAIMKPRADEKWQTVLPEMAVEAAGGWMEDGKVGNEGNATSGVVGGEGEASASASQPLVPLPRTHSMFGGTASTVGGYDEAPPVYSVNVPGVVARGSVLR
ncbi:hypothetical protein HDU67_008394, partial [Dinochytrium kinnereticum]